VNTFLPEVDAGEESTLRSDKVAESIGSIETDMFIEPSVESKATTTTRNSSTLSNTSNMCVGRRLRVRRTLRGISEEELCRKLGINRNDLNAYEEGIKRVNANMLLRIAKLLDVRPDYFF
jgi:ribosome-binding protein aMBF1 (putative translation factor)